MALHNVQVARSGVQYYHVDELPALGLTSIPREFRNNAVFGVYRPCHVLQDAASKVSNLPVIVGHTKWIADENDPLIKGRMQGDTNINIVDGELVIKGKIELADEAALDDAHELSLGYSSHNVWGKGVAPSGEEYQIISDRIYDINHLAIVPVARGGKNMRVLDGGGSMIRGLRSGLLRFVKRKLRGQTDGADAFTSTVSDVVKNISRWDETELEQHTNTLISLTSDLPESEEKEKLVRYIADVPMLKNEDEATINEAMSLIADLYNNLSKDAINDVIGEPTMVEETKTEAPEVVQAATPDAPVATPTDAPSATSGESEVVALLKTLIEKVDALSCAEKTEPAPAETPVADEAPAEEKKDEPETKVGDGIPLYTQTLGTVNAANSLDDVFMKMKTRR